MKSDKLPQVMSLGSNSVGAEDYKFENVGVELEESEFNRPL